MAAAAGILNHQMAAGQGLAAKGAAPMAAAQNSSTGSASGGAGTITANDFLTLLVTEMKNQDPTATTDPNEYINQLVNVNSLQQLISINQVLTTSLTPAAADSTGGNANARTQAIDSGIDAGVAGAMHPAAAQLAPGNLGIPASTPAASRIAQSLSGRS